MFHVIAFYFVVSLKDDDDDENGDGDGNEAEQACSDGNKENPKAEPPGSVSAEEAAKEEEEEPVTSGLGPLSHESKSQTSPMSDVPSPRHSPSQSESVQTDGQRPLSNGDLADLEQPVDSSNQLSVVLVSTTKAPPGAVSRPLSPVVIVGKCDTQTSNGTSPPPSPRTTRGQKRKRENTSKGPQNTKHTITHDR